MRAYTHVPRGETALVGSDAQNVGK